MMTEQQMTLKNDEMQEKWKLCVQTTCYAYRTVDRLREVIDNMWDIVRRMVNSIVEAFKPIVESFSTAFKDVVEFFNGLREDEIENIKSFPHSYPHFVENLRVNTKGFPRPINRCARSRC